MALNLNDTIQQYKAFPEQGTDRLITQMPLLIADGRLPISTSELMQRRLEVFSEGVSDEVRNNWWNIWVFTGDLAAYDSTDRFKVVLDFPLIRDLNPYTPCYHGAIQFGKTSEDATLVYEGLPGREFSRRDLEGRLNRSQSREEAKADQVWLGLARGDQSLLNNYVDAVFDQLKQKYSRTKGMGLWVSTPKIASGRPWVVDHLLSNSGAGGTGYADGNYGLLVGVAQSSEATCAMS